MGTCIFSPEIVILFHINYLSKKDFASPFPFIYLFNQNLPSKTFILTCNMAQAYFPPISQPEGLPLRIQDIKGKEWVFQFRFWPNNNSRMYVLEGVTPCIQSMQLQAGDTGILNVLIY